MKKEKYDRLRVEFKKAKEDGFNRGWRLYLRSIGEVKA